MPTSNCRQIYVGHNPSKATNDDGNVSNDTSQYVIESPATFDTELMKLLGISVYEIPLLDKESEIMRTMVADGRPVRLIGTLILSKQMANTVIDLRTWTGLAVTYGSTHEPNSQNWLREVTLNYVRSTISKFPVSVRGRLMAQVHRETTRMNKIPTEMIDGRISLPFSDLHSSVVSRNDRIRIVQNPKVQYLVGDVDIILGGLPGAGKTTTLMQSGIPLKIVGSDELPEWETFRQGLSPFLNWQPSDQAATWMLDAMYNAFLTVHREAVKEILEQRAEGVRYVWVVHSSGEANNITVNSKVRFWLSRDEGQQLESLSSRDEPGKEELLYRYLKRQVGADHAVFWNYLERNELLIHLSKFQDGESESELT
jgi:hypothetical protein